MCLLLAGSRSDTRLGLPVPVSPDHSLSTLHAYSQGLR